MELYRNIKKYRLQCGFTQDQLARLTGYTDRSSIAKIEKGLVDLSQSKVELFAKVLHVTAGELLGDASSSPPPSLSASEQELLKDFRQLNEEGQELVLKAARSYVRSGDYIKTDESELVEKKAGLL